MNKTNAADGVPEGQGKLAGGVAPPETVSPSRVRPNGRGRPDNDAVRRPCRDAMWLALRWPGGRAHRLISVAPPAQGATQREGRAQ